MPEPPVNSILGSQPSILDSFLAAVVLGPEGGGPHRAVENRARLLIVEDDFLTALQSQTSLEEVGYTVVGMAGSFEEALRFAEAEGPDLVIMDISLAGRKDGIEAATEILRRFAIPCLFVSAYTDEATRQRGQSARPLGWLTKPFTASQLVESVAAASSLLPPRKG